MDAMRIRLLTWAVLLLGGTVFLAAPASSPLTYARDPVRSNALSAALRQSPGAIQKVWVFFRDKGPDASARMKTAAVSPRAPR